MKGIAGKGSFAGVVLAVALAGLSGCKVGPNYKAPQTAAPAS